MFEYMKGFVQEKKKKKNKKKFKKKNVFKRKKKKKNKKNYSWDYLALPGSSTIVQISLFCGGGGWSSAPLGAVLWVPAALLFTSSAKNFEWRVAPTTSIFLVALGVLSVVSGSGFECIHRTLMTDTKTLKLPLEEFPLWLSESRTRLVSMRLRVQSVASLWVKDPLLP